MDNRAKRRKLNKLLKTMPENDKKHLMLATQQHEVAEALKRTTPSIILQGFHTCYIKLYDDFLKPIEEEVVTDEKGKQELINALILHIARERKLALEYRDKKETNNIKEEEVKENE